MAAHWKHAAGKWARIAFLVSACWIGGKDWAGQKLKLGKLDPGKPASTFLLSGIAQSAMSYDGTIIVTADYKTLQLWDVAKGKPLRELQVGYPPGWVPSLSFSRDGKMVVAAIQASPDEARRQTFARVFEVASGKPLCDLGKEHCVVSAAFSPDGRHVVTGFSRVAKKIAPVRLWSASTGKEIQAFPLALPVNEVAFSGDGSRIFARAHNWLVVWDIKTGKEIGRIDYPADSKSFVWTDMFHYQAMFTMNDLAVVMDRHKAKLRVWDLKKLDLRPRRELRSEKLGQRKLTQINANAVFPQFWQQQVSDDGRFALVKMGVLRRIVRYANKDNEDSFDERVTVKTALWDIENDRIIYQFPPWVLYRGNDSPPHEGFLLSGDGRTVMVDQSIWKLKWR